MSRSLSAPRSIPQCGLGGPHGPSGPREPHRRGYLRATVGLAAALVLGGCPDPEARFNKFTDKTDDDRDFMVPDMPPPPDLGAMLPDISGSFLLAVSTSISPELPMQFLLTTMMHVDMTGNATLDVSMQPLALTQGHVTTPRTPVGEQTDFTDAVISEGRFEVDAGTVTVPGEANPVTGSDIVVDLLLKATIISGDFFCGDLEGELIEPLNAPLMGSRFAAVRLADPDMLPSEVTINCAMDTVTGM